MTTKKKAAKRVERGVDALTFLEKISGPITFGRMMRSFRENDEMTQVSFARKLGIPRQHLCDIEKGRRPVSAEKAAAFAKKLGYSAHQFVALALQDQLRDAGLKMTVRIEAA